MAASSSTAEMTANVETMLEKIGKISNNNVAVIVEGKKDKAALERLDISSSRIFVLNRQPIFVVAEEIAKSYDEAVILTDLDEEGKKLYGKLSTLLQRLGVKVDNSLRNFLFKHTRLRQIEGIARLS